VLLQSDCAGPCCAVQLVELAHVLPTRGPSPAESALLQVATRGVVRLFNAVSPTPATRRIHHA
jgi:hypothetical protein